MATQHPDNACAPFWEKDGDGYISVYEELDECMACLKSLNVDEFMWDWEGKFADEAVIDKLFPDYYDYFKKHHLGQSKFLTFRLPNVWQEKGYSLIRALMVILTSEDFAHDLKFPGPPLFEVILPMTEWAEQLIYIQNSFKKLAKFKQKTFDHRKNEHSDYLHVIPLVESVQNQLGVAKLLRQYLELHKKYFYSKPPYLRPFLARSDPALVSGLTATVLANKLALSDIYEFSEKHQIPVYPIIGAGSLPFRGGLNPGNLSNFLKEYGGIRTVTIQSAFRYDYSLAQVKRAIKYLNKHLPQSQVRMVLRKDRGLLQMMVKKFEKSYQTTLNRLLKDLNWFFVAVPKRRERRQHIGFLAYQRRVGSKALPRAINFTAALYALGVPPEFIGLGRVLASLKQDEQMLLEKYYLNIRPDLEQAAGFINRDNLERLAKANSAWQQVAKDVVLVEKIFNIKLGPKSQNELLHQNLSSNLWLQRKNLNEVDRLIVETGKLRKSLG